MSESGMSESSTAQSGTARTGPVQRGTAESKAPEDSTPEIAGAPYRPTARTVPTRSRERAAYDRELVHRILDEAYVCHLGFVRDGAPVVLPTLYGRVDERLYVHGSTGSRPLRMAGRQDAEGRADGQADDPGLAVCLTVTHVDGLVLARSAFHHSINYRSVVVHGIARQVTDPQERSTALDAIVDHVVPGRSRDSRPANARELAATAVLRLDLDEVSAKVRTGGPNDEPEDTTLPYWTGVVPVVRGYGTPVPADDLDPAVPVPGYLSAL
ncbi:pyridoxamine 5'-phosphate oxidase family protein [Streptomyces sp. NPDC051569]|uniref:pyridoxamine 5'-phosphate oxidase family protein n=1 Tax=Streptomyces sp. NPDC051569 TaxID=3365661 RepID=UPI0037B26E70